MDEEERRIEAVQKRIGSPSCQGFIHFREGHSLGKTAPEKFWIELHLRKLCDVESRGRGRREVESTNRDEPRRRQKRRPSLPPSQAAFQKRQREGGGLWRLARAAREGRLGPFESSRNEVCTAALSEVRNRTQSQKMRIDRRYLQGLRMWLMRVSM